MVQLAQILKARSSLIPLKGISSLKNKMAGKVKAEVLVLVLGLKEGGNVRIQTMANSAFIAIK